jgi:hypothetical protein
MSTILHLDEIVIDQTIQPREHLDEAAVAEWSELMKDPKGATRFPDPVVFHDGAVFRLADGFHRIAARRLAGCSDVPCEVRPGDCREARLWAASANVDHGVRRSNEDKRRSVRVLLDDSEWSQWSDRRIADHCGVGHSFVSALRGQLSAVDSSSTELTQRIGKDGKSRRAPQKRQQGDDDQKIVVSPDDAAITREDGATVATRRAPIVVDAACTAGAVVGAPCWNCSCPEVDEDGACQQCCDPAPHSPPIKAAPTASSGLASPAGSSPAVTPEVSLLEMIVRMTTEEIGRFNPDRERALVIAVIDRLAARWPDAHLDAFIAAIKIALGACEGLGELRKGIAAKACREAVTK